jgi:hypothetical protein
MWETFVLFDGVLNRFNGKLACTGRKLRIRMSSSLDLFAVAASMSVDPGCRYGLSRSPQTASPRSRLSALSFASLAY